MRSNAIKSGGAICPVKPSFQRLNPRAEKSSVNFLLFTGRLETALPMVVRKIYPTAHFDLTQSFRFGTG
jgi:hypothetical protein